MYLAVSLKWNRSFTPDWFKTGPAIHSGLQNLLFIYLEMGYPGLDVKTAHLVSYSLRKKDQNVEEAVLTLRIARA